MKEKIRSNKKWILGGILAVAFIIFGAFYTMSKDGEQKVAADTNSSTEKEYVKLSGDIEGLTDKQVNLIENEVIPLASEFFEYEEARVYYSKHVGYVISFVVTNESFGKTYSEYLEPTMVSFQSDAIEMIHRSFKKASMALDPIIIQADGVTMEFKLPKMDGRLLMKVRGGEFIVTPFIEEE